MTLLQHWCAAAFCLVGAASLGIAADTTPVMFRGDARHSGSYVEGPRHLRLKWRFQTRGKIRSTPAISDGIVCFGSEDGYLYAIDAEKGTLRWKYATDGDLSSSPAIAGGVVYVTGGDGAMLAVDLETGKLRWRYETGKRLPFEQFAGDPRSWDMWQSSPAVDGERVYFGSGDGFIYALARNSGRLAWKYGTDAIVRTSPAVAAGVVYVGGFDGKLYALDAEAGKLKWSFKTEGNPYFPKGEIQGSPSVADNRVFFGARDGFVYAVDATSGKQLWRSDHKGSWVPTSPAVANGLVFAGSSDGQFVQAIDAATGVEKWRFEAKMRVFASPTVAGGRLYVGITNGDLVVLNAADGKEIARNNAEDPIFSSPAIANRILYVGSDDSCLYAFGPSPVETYSAVSVEATVLDRYAGDYDTGLGMKISISHEGSHLMVQSQQNSIFEALSSTRFFNRDLDMELDFSTADKPTMFQSGYKIPLQNLR